MRTIREALTEKIVGWLDNPHTSISALTFIAFKVAGVFWPKYKNGFDDAAALCITYGLIQAGDAKPRNGKMTNEKPPTP